MGDEQCYAPPQLHCKHTWPQAHQYTCNKLYWNSHLSRRMFIDVLMAMYTCRTAGVMRIIVHCLYYHYSVSLMSKILALF